MTAPRQTARPAARPLALKKILVPVDFSAGSAQALDYALGLVGAGTSLHLLHVAEINSVVEGLGSADFPEVERRLREHADRQLTALIRDRIGGRVPATVEVRSGWPFGGKRPYAEIVDAARAIGADLIVLGTQGRTGLDHLLLGSTAERVVRHAPCPVLTVRAPIEAKQARACSRSEQSSSG
jgi:nucleotide-binding universal stress UspA family protein